MENKDNQKIANSSEVNNDKVENDIEDIEVDENVDELSVEEFEEQENDYIDEGLVDNDELENLQKHFDIQIVKEEKGDPMDMDVEEEPEIYKKEFEDFETDGEIYSIAINDKGIVAIGDGEDTTYLFDINKKELKMKEKLNKDSVVSVGFSIDNKYLAVASLDGTVNIFDGESFKLLNTVSGPNSDINVI